MIALVAKVVATSRFARQEHHSSTYFKQVQYQWLTHHLVQQHLINTHQLFTVHVAVTFVLYALYTRSLIYIYIYDISLN